ncbi:MAG TPA: LysR family transcriptional regulator [Sphingomicrobium sp.]|nr:LysR family transcriptional regulator [Sphingomicrobium sp.]
MIELRHLRYVIAAAERGSFRRAARTLGVQESAVSRRIRDLELRIGATLFVRHHGGVDLTFAGECFLAQARRALNEIDCAASEAATLGRGEAGAIRIGILHSLACGFLSDLLRAYVSAHPVVRPELVEGSPATHISAVQKRDLDVAFLAGTPSAEGCELAHLWDEPVFVAMPSEDALARKRKIRWDELRDRRFIVSETELGPEIRAYLVKNLAEPGYRPAIERHAVSRDNLMSLVALGQGLTLTSEALIAARFPGVAYRRLCSEILPFCAIWLPENDNPALRRFLSLACSMTRTKPAATSISPRSDGEQQSGLRGTDVPGGVANRGLQIGLRDAAPARFAFANPRSVAMNR